MAITDVLFVFAQGGSDSASGGSSDESSPWISAIFGLVGVLIGGGVTWGAEQSRQSHEEKIRKKQDEELARGLARVLADDLSHLVRVIEAEADTGHMAFRPDRPRLGIGSGSAVPAIDRPGVRERVKSAHNDRAERGHTSAGDRKRTGREAGAWRLTQRDRPRHLVARCRRSERCNPRARTPDDRGRVANRPGKRRSLTGRIVRMTTTTREATASSSQVGPSPFRSLYLLLTASLLLSDGCGRGAGPDHA